MLGMYRISHLTENLPALSPQIKINYTQKLLLSNFPIVLSVPVPTCSHKREKNTF